MLLARLATMIPEIDIWRSAHLMIRQYGEDGIVPEPKRAICSSLIRAAALVHQARVVGAELPLSASPIN